MPEQRAQPAAPPPPLSAVRHPEDQPALGALFLFIGIIAVALMDAIAKIAAAEVPVLQVTWGRFVFHCLVIAPFALFACRTASPWRAVRRGDLRWRTVGLHAMRGVFLAAASICFFTSIRDNPVPDALAVFFIEPLIVMIMARYFLGEAFNRRLLIAAFVGLLGVLIILRPGAATEYRWTIVFSLGAAVLFAGYIVSARFASFNTSAIVTSWLTAFFGLFPVLPLAFFVWQPPDGRVWGLLMAIGVLSGVGHSLIILACRYASASNIAVMHYAEVGVAALISWILFSHIPGVWVWVGIVIIAGANLYALKPVNSGP